jgi:hypothetical protein
MSWTRQSGGTQTTNQAQNTTACCREVFEKQTVWIVSQNCVCKICDLLGYYASSSGNPLPTIRDNVSVPSSRNKKSKKNTEPLGCPETSVKDYRSALRNIPEECTCNQHRDGSLKPRTVFALCYSVSCGSRSVLLHSYSYITTDVVRKELIVI